MTGIWTWFEADIQEWRLTQRYPERHRIEQRLLKLAFASVLIYLGCVASAFGQTVSPTPDRNTPVTVTQGYIDDSTKAFALVVELRDALQKEQMAGGASQVTKAALQAQITALNDVIAIKDRKDAVYQSLLDLRDQAFAVYEKVIKIQADMIEKLYAQLNKPASAWHKFVRAVERIAMIALGISLGRGLPL